MRNDSKKKNLFAHARRHGFTMVEIAAAVVILGIMLSSVLVLMNRYVDAVVDMQLRKQAFELARTNMETLLSEDKISDLSEYGTDEYNPDLDWTMLVEPFYEPVTNQMWIRAVCTASYLDSKTERQEIELEHWITNLTAAQIKQILEQQKIDSEYMDLLQSGQYTDIQLATIAYLEQENLDVQAYKDLLEQHRREKLEYLDQNGTKNYDKFLEDLEEEENQFLEDLGMNFDDYNIFAANYEPPKTKDPDDPKPKPEEIEEENKIEIDCIDCTGFSEAQRKILDAFPDVDCCAGT